MEADARYTYQQDAEGNRILRTDRLTGETVRYTYDHRNRLTAVEGYSAGGQLQFEVRYTYDVFDRRIARVADPDGAGPLAAETTHYVYDGVQVWADFDASMGSLPATWSVSGSTS